MDKKDLDYLINEIKVVNLPEGKLAEFCPCIYDCSKQGVDSNCFYEKFLHCEEVDKLNLNNKLSEENLQNRKIYKLLKPKKDRISNIK